MTEEINEWRSDGKTLPIRPDCFIAAVYEGEEVVATISGESAEHALYRARLICQAENLFKLACESHALLEKGMAQDLVSRLNEAIQAITKEK